MSEQASASLRRDKRDRKRVVQADNVFFRQFPDRQYRVRLASPVEIRQKALNGGLPPRSRGLRWFLAIWCPATATAAPARRICLFIPNRENADTNLYEGTAHAVFDYAAESSLNLVSRMASVAELLITELCQEEKFEEAW